MIELSPVHIPAAPHPNAGVAKVMIAAVVKERRMVRVRCWNKSSCKEFIGNNEVGRGVWQELDQWGALGGHVG